MNNILFNRSIFKRLPKILKETTSFFTEPYQQDIHLFGALGILSGCLPNVYGNYMDDKVSANLYCYLMANAGANKRPFVLSFELGKGIQKFKRKAYEDDKREYLEKLKQIPKQKLNNANSDLLPKRPIPKGLFFPPDCTLASLYKFLLGNDSRGILKNSEGDSFANSFNSKFGDPSETYRQAFQNETVSYSRVSEDDLTIEIERPELSIAICSTPAQFYRGIDSSEDGLGSRFLYYLMEGSMNPLDPRPGENEMTIEEKMVPYSDKVLELYKVLTETSIMFNLSESQWDDLNEDMKPYFKESGGLYGAFYLAFCKRIYLMQYRICMILTTIRSFESGKLGPKLVCSDDDYEIAKEIIAVCKIHAESVFSNFPRVKNVKFKSSKRFEQFFHSLNKGQEYNYDQLKQELKKHGIGKTAFFDNFKSFEEAGWITKIGRGIYIVPLVSGNNKPE